MAEIDYKKMMEKATKNVDSEKRKEFEIELDKLIEINVPYLEYQKVVETFVLENAEKLYKLLEKRFVINKYKKGKGK